MATIYTRIDNNGIKKYYGNINHNNLRIRRYLGLTKKSAELALKKLEYKVLFEEPVTKAIPSITFNQAILSFLKDVERTSVATRQVKVIKTKVSWFLDFCKNNGITSLESISKKHAHQYIQRRKSTLPRASTINKEIGFIKRFFNHCITMEWLNRNPFIGVNYFKSDNHSQRYYFSISDINGIMNNANSYFDFFTFLYCTGLRSTDAFNLKPSHVKGRYLVKQMNKTGDWLNIPLSDNAMNILIPRVEKDYIFHELQTAFRRRKCTHNLKDNFEPDFVRKNNINLHTFRHTYAHNMLNKGVPKEVLQTLLGHRSIKTTEIYANWVRKEELERWVT